MNRPPSFFDLREVAMFYSDALYKLKYPKHPSQPQRSDFKDNVSFGVAMDDYENVKLIEYKEARAIYYEFEKQILSEFQDELISRLGLLDHPKANKLYEMAWEHGHASGLGEVASYAEDLAQLLKDDVKES